MRRIGIGKGKFERYNPENKPHVTRFDLQQYQKHLYDIRQQKLPEGLRDRTDRFKRS